MEERRKHDEFINAVNDAKTVMEQFQRILIEARDSVPPSMSQQIRDQNSRIQSLHEKVDNLTTAVQPVVEAFTDSKKLRSQFWEFAKYVGIFSAAWVALKLIGHDIWQYMIAPLFVNHIKHDTRDIL